MEVALEAASLDVAGGDDPRSRRSEVGEPGVKLVIQAMDLRRPAPSARWCPCRRPCCPRPGLTASLTGAAAIETSTSVPSFRWRTVSKSLTHSPARTLTNSSSLSARFDGGAIGRPGAADHFLARPAEDALGRRVPQADARIETELHERERRRVDQRLEPRRPAALLRDRWATTSCVARPFHQAPFEPAG